MKKIHTDEKGKLDPAQSNIAKKLTGIKVYRSGDERGRAGMTFYSTKPEGAQPYAQGSGKPIKEHTINPKKLFDTSANINNWRMYNQFLEETGHPAGRGKNGFPFWTAEPDLKKWLDEKKFNPDAIKFDENTGIPSIAVYD